MNKSMVYKIMFFVGLGGAGSTALLPVFATKVSIPSWIWGGVCFVSLVISLIQKIRKVW